MSGSVNFNHRKGCQKCVVVGEFSKEFRTMSFPDITCPPRTDESFRNRTDQLHHKETSVMEQLNIDMIMSFPTSDSLHLLDLGVMKKCMLRWTFGEKGFKRKWSKAHVDLVSRLLLKCAGQMPTEFHRKVRSLNYLRQWKGVEYRAILLYVGIVVLKKVLDDDLYQHFVSLCCAVRICSCSLYKRFQPLAKKLFELYVTNYGNLYGTHRIGSNVHNLSHIVEDMEYNDVGNLMTISTYRFENCLRILGLQLKHGHLPLEQISRRIIEKSKIKNAAHNYQSFNAKYIDMPKVSYESHCVEENRKIYNKILITPSIFLSNRRFGDSWFLSDSNDIVKMRYAIQDGNNFKICGQKIEQKESFFKCPIDSVNFDIYVSNGELSEELFMYSTNSILAKMMCLPFDDNSVFIPHLDSLETLSK